MSNNLLVIKSLFKKLASAGIWCQSHRQTEQSQLLIESYYEALERLGVFKQFSWAVFIFGISGEVAHRSWSG